MMYLEIGICFLKYELKLHLGCCIVKEEGIFSVDLEH